MSKTKEAGDHPVPAPENTKKIGGPDSKPMTKAVFINEVERSVKFGDDADKVVRVLKKLGVDAEVQSYSAMTDEELAKASEKFTEEEKIGALYYMIHLANDLGMCFEFNCKKHLVMYERRWPYSDKMNSKSVTDVEAAKGSEILGAVPCNKNTDAISRPDKDAREGVIETGRHGKVPDKLSPIPIDSRSAPRRSPEGPPPAKPGSAPR